MARPAPTRPAAGGLSFQGKIAAVALTTAVAVLLAASGLFILEQWRAERLSRGKSIEALAGLIAADTGDAVGRNQPWEVQDTLKAITAIKAIREVRLTDGHGQPIGAYARPEIGHEHWATQTAVTPIMVHGLQDGEVKVVVDVPPMKSFIARYFAVIGALFFVAAGLALFLGRWLAARITGPIERLSGAMRELADSGDYSRRVEPLMDDEFGKLTGAFNELVAQLEANDRALRQTLVQLMDARDAAETANVLKSQFLANMSHEIRTPLNGVLAMAQIMAMGELAPTQRERLDVIRHSGEALLSVLNDVLDLSKIEAGKMELETAPLDGAEIGAQVHAAFRGMAEKKKLAFSLDIDPDAVGQRLGDPVRITQILNNLVSNAIKFTEAGQVRIVVEGDGEGGAEGLRFMVLDTGAGIAADKLPFLFQKFTQADSSTTRKFGGTGLGLAICRELAQLMGGAVTAVSAEGEGSCFTLILPLARIAAASAEAPEPAPTAATEPSGRAPRILAAEDNPTNQLVLKTIMQTFGADLTLVGDGRAAVEAWRAGDYDLILMDIQMPEMDGVAASKAIREMEAITGRARTPIIAVSANAMTHQVREYLAAGMDAHVAKPIELARLHAVMMQTLAEAEAEADQAASGEPAALSA